jgi:hypothetical protein
MALVVPLAHASNEQLREQIALLQNELDQRQIPEAHVVPQVHGIPLQFISLIRSGPHWKKGWKHCFDRKDILTESCVKVGDSGSIGIGYWIDESLDARLEGCTNSAERVQKIININAINQDTGETIGERAIKMGIVPFYELSHKPNGTLFGIKWGTTGMWVAKKTGDYYYVPRTPGKAYYCHRFNFEIVYILTEAEGKFRHHLDLIYTTKLASSS